MSAPNDGTSSAPTQALIARLDTMQAKAEQSMAATCIEAVRTGFPKPAIAPAPADARITTGDMAPVSSVELDDAVGDDSVVLIARDPITGKALLKIWMAKADASPEWGLWVRRWIAWKYRRSIHLLR